jgi:hypothetical protein
VVARPAHSFQHPAASTLLDLITTQHNKLCIDLHTHTRHTHIEICAQTKKQHLILSKALKSPSSLITSSTASSSSSLSCQKSSSNIAFTNFTKSYIKNCLPTLSIFYQRLVTEITSAPKICLPASSIFHQRLLSKIINLHQRLPTNFTKDCLQLQQSCITKVCLPTSIKDCSQTSTFSTGWTLLDDHDHLLLLLLLLLLHHHHHPCSSVKHLFLGFKVWKILLLFSITLPSSSSPPSPSYIPSKFPGKNPSSEKPHPWLLCRLGGWMGGWMGRLQSSYRLQLVCRWH